MIAEHGTVADVRRILDVMAGCAASGDDLFLRRGGELYSFLDQVLAEVKRKFPYRLSAVFPEGAIAILEGLHQELASRLYNEDG
jgi:hypothetical protein